MVRFGGSSVQFGLRWDTGFQFIYPSGMLQDPEDPLRPKQITVHGILKLKLAKPKTFTKIVVTSAVRYVVALPHETPYEGERMSMDCVALEETRDFEAGVHDLPIAFIYPASLQVSANRPFHQAGYIQYLSLHTQATCQTGKTYEGNLPKLFKPGDKRIAWEASDTDHCRLWANPAQIGELPPPLNIRIADYLETFGPCLIQAWGNAFTIASLIHFRVAFDDPLTDFSLLSFRVYVLETVKFKSPKPPYATHVFQETSHLVCEKKGEKTKPLCRAQRHKAFEFVHTARMPHDEQIEASTLIGTVGPEHVSHRLCFELEVSPAPHQRQFIRIHKPVTIPLCTCLPETLLVPSYTEFEGKLQSHDEFQPERKRDPFPCICGFSLQQLLDRENAAEVSTQASNAGSTLDLAPKREVIRLT